MEIIPNKLLIDIPTGNPYKGRSGLVDIGPLQSSIDVAELFPFHEVSVRGIGLSKNIVSHILNRQIRVFYNIDNFVSEIEVLSPTKKIPELLLDELLLYDFNIFENTLVQVREQLNSMKIDSMITDVGLELKDSKVSFYSAEFDGDLNVNVDAVAIGFQ